MVVTVRLHTALQQVSARGRTGELSLHLPEGATVSMVVEGLNLPIAMEHLLLVIDRRVVDPDTPLHEGEVLDLIPAMEGG